MLDRERLRHTPSQEKMSLFTPDYSKNAEVTIKRHRHEASGLSLAKSETRPNQDAFFTTRTGAIGAFDGLGGPGGGEIASQIAAITFQMLFEIRLINDSQHQDYIAQVMQEGWAMTRKMMDTWVNLNSTPTFTTRDEVEIWDEIRRTLPPRDEATNVFPEMATTAIVGQVFRDGNRRKILIAHTGDSPGEIITNTGEVKKIVRPHKDLYTYLPEILAYADLDPDTTAELLEAAYDILDNAKTIEQAKEELINLHEAFDPEFIDQLLDPRMMNTLNKYVGIDSSGRYYDPTITVYDIEDEDLFLHFHSDGLDVLTQKEKSTILRAGVTDPEILEQVVSDNVTNHLLPQIVKDITQNADPEEYTWRLHPDDVTSVHLRLR